MIKKSLTVGSVDGGRILIRGGTDGELKWIEDGGPIDAIDRPALYEALDIAYPPSPSNNELSAFPEITKALKSAYGEDDWVFQRMVNQRTPFLKALKNPGGALTEEHLLTAFDTIAVQEREPDLLFMGSTQLSAVLDLDKLEARENAASIPAPPDLDSLPTPEDFELWASPR